MTLEDYFRRQLGRADPYPAIDHSIRAQLHEDGRISFYIHADGRDSDTQDFWVNGNTLTNTQSQLTESAAVCSSPHP